MRLRHCFYGYMRAHQAEIFSFVEELVKPITVSRIVSENIMLSFRPWLKMRLVLEAISFFSLPF